VLRNRGVTNPSGSVRRRALKNLLKNSTNRLDEGYIRLTYHRQSCQKIIACESRSIVKISRRKTVVVRSLVLWFPRLSSLRWQGCVLQPKRSISTHLPQTPIRKNLISTTQKHLDTCFLCLEHSFKCASSLAHNFLDDSTEKTSPSSDRILQ